MTDAQLLKLAQRLVNKWQPILNVPDWHVEVLIVRPGHRMYGDYQAKVWTTPKLKEATIAINAEEVPGTMLWNFEGSCVHELLHIVTSPWFEMIKELDSDQAREHALVMLEGAIEGMARGLVKVFGEKNRRL